MRSANNRSVGPTRVFRSRLDDLGACSLVLAPGMLVKNLRSRRSDRDPLQVAH